METNKTEVEIDLKEIMYLLLDKIWIIGISTIVAGLFAFIFTKTLITPMYQSSTSMFVMNKETGTSINYSDLQVSNMLTNDYLQIVKSRTVLNRVKENLNLECTISDLASRITVTTPTNTRILEISVLDEDAFMAKKIADAVAKYSSDYICETMDTEKVNVIDEGNVPTAPTSPSVLKNVIIGIALGMIFAIAIIVVRYMVDDTIKSEEDVERFLGCSMLAGIPYVEILDDTIGKKTRRKAGVKFAKG